MSYNYKFTVIVPAHNAAEYMDDAVASVVAQDLGIDHIQLVLVDDASEDRTGSLIDGYAEKYPGSVVAVHADAPGGFAHACNRGLALAKGEYLHFLSPKNRLTADVLRKAAEFLDGHVGETEMVFISGKFCPNRKSAEAKEPLFRNGAGVVSPAKEYRYDLRSVFFRAAALEGMAFDEHLPEKYCFEKTVLQLLARGGNVGVMDRGTYMCRCTAAGGDAGSDDCGADIPDRFRHFYLSLLDTADPVPPVIRHAVRKKLTKILQNDRKADAIPADLQPEARRLFTRILQKLDDASILSESNPSISALVALRMKYADRMPVEETDGDILLGNAESPERLAVSGLPLSLDTFEMRDNCGLIECSFPVFDDAFADFVICARIDRTLICGEKNGEHRFSAAHGMFEGRRADFTLKIPFPVQGGEIRFFLRRGNRLVPLHSLAISKFFPLSNRYRSAYFLCGKWCMTCNGSGLKIGRRRFWSFPISESRFLRELWQKRLEGGRKAVIARTVYHLLRPFVRKPIWMCADRPEKADDNGEVFFEYLRREHPEIRSYFVIGGDSPDYERIRKIGPVLKTGSFRHKLLYLFSECAISSQAVIYAATEYRKIAAYNDIIRKTKIVFLQHGIIKDDLSSFLGRKKHNFFGFVTSAEREYDSILHGSYGYTEKDLWLTGLPRFDKLYCAEPRYITFMPTWRSYLMTTPKKRCNFREISRAFMQSAYFQFYHAVFNDRRLIDAARRYGYELAVLPHPQMQPFIDEFSPDPSILRLGVNRTLSYREIYAESALVITDYSSAVFDFAYLRKPVIYAQFDKDEFYANHTYTKGYFEYERDGFGEVEHDLDSTVERIIEYMRGGCKLKDLYRQRIEAFFTFHDQNCCRRIYDKIMASGK